MEKTDSKSVQYLDTIQYDKKQEGIPIKIEGNSNNVKDIIESLLYPAEYPTKVFIIQLYHAWEKNGIDLNFYYKILDWDKTAHLFDFEINTTGQKFSRIKAIVWTNKSIIHIDTELDEPESIIITKIPIKPKAKVIEVIKDQ